RLGAAGADFAAHRSQHMHPFLRTKLGVALSALLLLGATACSSTAGTSSGATATTAPTATTGPTTTSTPLSIPIKVYFSKRPASDTNAGAVFPVNRTAPSLAVATYATQQLLAGPTAAETAAGYYTPFVGALSGSSNCGGPDFSIALDVKGTTPEPGTATLKFCRSVNIPGELAGGARTAELTATLTQFNSIHKAVILTVSGACLADLSGMNLCLK